MADLGTLPGGEWSQASGINASGQVVGESGYHAFLYSSGTMTDLNNLIDPSSGWMLTQATGINTQGQIVCEGENASGQNRVFLLTPPAMAATRLPRTI